MTTAVISLATAFLAWWDSRSARREAKNATVIAREVRSRFDHLTEVVGLERACATCDTVLGHLRDRKLAAAAEAAMKLHDILPRIPQVGDLRISQNTTAPTIDDAIQDICLNLQRDIAIRKIDVEARNGYVDVILKIRRVLAGHAGTRQQQVYGDK